MNLYGCTPSEECVCGVHSVTNMHGGVHLVMNLSCTVHLVMNLYGTVLSDKSVRYTL